MQTFQEWLSQLRLLRLLQETWFTFDPAEYDRLFDEELQKVLTRTTDPAHREALNRMRGFHWMSYVAAALRHAGWRDQREVQERSHDLAVQLLTGKLFTGFDERRSGPFDLRFRASVRNAIVNMAQKEQNRRRLLPTVPIQPEFEPGRYSRTDDDDEKVIQDFRRLVRRRLGELALAVLDARLGGEQTKSLVGRFEFGSPDKNVIKRVVQGVKALAREYALWLGDPDFLRMVERAMASESETIRKRKATVAARQRVGA